MTCSQDDDIDSLGKALLAGNVETDIDIDIDTDLPTTLVLRSSSLRRPPLLPNPDDDCLLFVRSRRGRPFAPSASTTTAANTYPFIGRAETRRSFVCRTHAPRPRSPPNRYQHRNHDDHHLSTCTVIYAPSSNVSHYGGPPIDSVRHFDRVRNSIIQPQTSIRTRHWKTVNRNTITYTISHTTQHGILIAVGGHAPAAMRHLGISKGRAGIKSHVSQLPDIWSHHIRLQDIEHAAKAASTRLLLVETHPRLVAHVQSHGRSRRQLPHR